MGQIQSCLPPKSPPFTPAYSPEIDVPKDKFQPSGARSSSGDDVDCGEKVCLSVNCVSNEGEREEQEILASDVASADQDSPRKDVKDDRKDSTGSISKLKMKIKENLKEDGTIIRRDLFILRDTNVTQELQDEEYPTEEDVMGSRKKKKKYRIKHWRRGNKKNQKDASQSDNDINTDIFNSYQQHLLIQPSYSAERRSGKKKKAKEPSSYNISLQPPQKIMMNNQPHIVLMDDEVMDTNGMAGTDFFKPEQVRNSEEKPVGLFPIDITNQIYACDTGLTRSHCQSLMSITESYTQGVYAAYTYAKQTLGCREHPFLSLACAKPCLRVCSTIRNIDPDKDLILDDREPHMVKYDVSKRERTKLDMHTDKSEWTFLIALSEKGRDYEGGGTFFECNESIVHIQQGQCLIFPGKLRHRGEKISRGLRFLLVGFLVREKEISVTKTISSSGQKAGDTTAAAVSSATAAVVVTK